ncbi:MAG: hypothetical protein JWM96_862 [Alphaproteobacteria bacterium]|nr:hypothetical protein [Alphaproteobacteria bacterium]
MRWTLPVLALLTLALAIAWPALKEMQVNKLSEQSATRLRVEGIAMTMPGAGKPVQLQMNKPEYSGLDDQGRPYVITADHVIQEGMQPGTSAMQLEKPTAQLTLDGTGKEHVDVDAATGFYDPAQKTLQLSGPVKVTHTTGYTLDLQDMSVDFIKGSGITDNPVSGRGPGGTLTGEKMEMQDRGNRIILKGRSKIILTPKENG